MFTLSLEGLRPYRRRLAGEGVFAERFILRRRFIPERTRKKARHCIDHQHRRKLSTAEHVIPNANFLRREIFGDAFVHSLVTPTEKNNPIELRVAARGLLSKKFPGGG